MHMAKILQMLQVVAFGNLADGRSSQGDFVRSMFTLINSFAKFFNKHGVELMRITLQVFSGVLQIIQGEGVGQFMQAFKNFSTTLLRCSKKCGTNFFLGFLEILGPIGDLLEFTEDVLCDAIKLIADAINTVKNMIKPAGGI